MELRLPEDDADILKHMGILTIYKMFIYIHTHTYMCVLIYIYIYICFAFVGLYNKPELCLTNKCQLFNNKHNGMASIKTHIEIYVMDQQMHTSRICLSYIIYYLHVSVATVTITRVPSKNTDKYNKLPYCI